MRRAWFSSRGRAYADGMTTTRRGTEGTPRVDGSDGSGHDGGRHDSRTHDGQANDAGGRRRGDGRATGETGETDMSPPTGGSDRDATVPERTPDGRYLVIAGRRWRASDPGIPEKLRVELVEELMAARRLVRTEPTAARPRVQDAKVALGERGEEWWSPTDAGRRARLGAAIRALLRHRGGTTICPSEAARVVGGDDWRDLMPMTRDVAAELAADGVLGVQQKGVDVDPATVTGPVRLAPRDLAPRS